LLLLLVLLLIPYGRFFFPTVVGNNLLIPIKAVVLDFFPVYWSVHLSR
jgi:hypothetical protein